MTYGISNYGISGCSGLGGCSGLSDDHPLKGTQSQLYSLAGRARRRLRGLGNIEPPGSSDYTQGYPVDEGILRVSDELYGSPNMADAFVPANNNVVTMGVSAGEPDVYSENPPIEDREFKDVIINSDSSDAAKKFGGLAMLGLAALGYFIFIRK